MKLSEFEKGARGPYAFSHWLSRVRLPSPIGDFVIELQVPSGEVPDDTMLAEAEILARAFDQRVSAIAAKVNEHYMRLKEDPEWARDCGVPLGLELPQLAPYLRSRNLVVSRDATEKSVNYYTGIYISPMWDIEHGICLRLADRGVEFE